MKMKKVMMLALFTGSLMLFAAGCCSNGATCDKPAACPTKAQVGKEVAKVEKGAADAVKGCAAKKANKACPCGDKCPGASCTTCNPAK